MTSQYLDMDIGMVVRVMSLDGRTFLRHSAIEGIRTTHRGREFKVFKFGWIPASRVLPRFGKVN